MALRGGVGAIAANSIPPWRFSKGQIAQMSRVSAIHHIIGRATPCHRVYVLNRLFQAFAGGESAVSFNGERNRRRQPTPSRCEDYADSFGRISKGQGGNH